MQAELIEHFKVRLAGVRESISRAAEKSGRNPVEVTLVAVSKTQSHEVILAAYEGGQRIFGENRVQEMLGKVPLLPADVEWHLIGHLQSNKVRKVLPACEMLHGVDSLDLAREIDRIASETGRCAKILLEVNVAGEVTKFGFQPEHVIRDLESVLALPGVSVAGFMTIAPYVEDSELARHVFSGLRELRDRCEARSGKSLPVLSMGMTNDFEVAIEEGATHVRIGSAIFGART